MKEGFEDDRKFCFQIYANIFGQDHKNNDSNFIGRRFGKYSGTKHYNSVYAMADP